MTEKIGAGKRVLVTGGAGYVGSRLVPELLKLGYRVTVLDIYIFGSDVFREYKEDPNLKEVKGDLRDIICVNDCLLYTSPSPRDGLLSRMPSSA